MFRALREFLRALRTSRGRFRFLFFLIRELPGEYGILLRRRLLHRRFESAGENLQILEGVHIRNIHKIKVGDNVGIGDECFIQAGGGLEIGNDVLLGPGVKVWTQNHRFDNLDVPIRQQGAEYRKVTVGDDVWIGANAFIMPGADLPRGCIVSAGAVVAGRKYKEYAILAGNPARVIGFRNAMKKESEPPETEQE